MKRGLKRMHKKGAIEMSMQTIIIIIIGVTLLSLGIKFVVDTMSKTTSMSDEMFESGGSLINEIYGSSSDVMTARPNDLTVKQGESQSVQLFVRNTGSDPADFTLSLSSEDGAGITSWIKLGASKKNVPAGGVWKKTVLVAPTKTVKPNSDYIVTVSCAGAACNDESVDFVVHVKGSG